MHRGLQQFASLVLVVVILMSPAFCLCQEIHHGANRPECSLTAGHDAIEDCADQSPDCPGDHNPGADHDASGCYCSCHLPVTEQPIRIHHSPLIVSLTTFEPFTALPEVFLPKFIPPQNQA